MARPSRNDKMIQHFMKSQKVENKVYSSTESSEYINLKYDIDRGIQLLPHKMKRFLELKEKLGK